MIRIGEIELAEKPECIIGLDLSLTGTGFARFILGDVIEAHVISTDGLKGMRRLQRLRDAVFDGLVALSPTLFVVMEGYAFGAANAREALAELGGVIKLHFWQQKIPLVIVPPPRLKKFVTGKGNADKAQIVKEVYKRFGYDAADDNVADAVGLCYLGRALVGEWTPTTDAQREVVADILKGKQKKERK